VEQSTQQSGAEPVGPWWQFKPGHSGNPRGNSMTRARYDAETERLIASLNHRASAVEVALIRQLAALNMRRPTIESARIASRIASQLGYSSTSVDRRAKSRPRKSRSRKRPVPMPSGYASGE